MAKKDNIFVSPTEEIRYKQASSISQRTTNYLNSKFPNLMWKLQNNVIAPVKNHRDYPMVRDYLINFTATTTIFVIILWCFSITKFIRKGFGIAVIVALVQYYTKWYFGVRQEPPKRVFLANNSLKVDVQNNSLDVRVRQ